MTIRPLIDSDYDNYIVPFWKSWGDLVPEKDLLPQDGTGGFIVFDKDVAVCAGFAYMTNSKVAWTAWVCSNKDYTNRKNRKLALYLLLDTLSNVCEQSGYKYLFSVIKNEALVKIYEESGYAKAATGTEMFKRLK